MGPQSKLMPLAGTIVITLSLALPALAAQETARPATAALSHERAAPLKPQRPATRPALRADSAPAEQQPPPPAPSGCPFRDGKLELMV